MDKDTVEALTTMSNLQVIEQAFRRQIPGAFELLPLATETQDAFLASASSVHNISAESEEKRARGLELSEAEARVSFDRLNDLLFGGHVSDNEVNTYTMYVSRRLIGRPSQLLLQRRKTGTKLPQ